MCFHSTGGGACRQPDPCLNGSSPAVQDKGKRDTQASLLDRESVSTPGRSIAQLQPSRKRAPGIEAQRVLAVFDGLLRKLDLLATISDSESNDVLLPPPARPLAESYRTQLSDYAGSLPHSTDAESEELTKTARSLFRAADGTALVSPATEVCVCVCVCV
jgi:hypothetical protein